MTKKLKTFVTVHRTDEQGNPTGETRTVGPNDDLSAPENDWIPGAISNPHVWQGAAEPAVAEDLPRPEATEATMPDPGTIADPPPASTAPSPSPPPRRGPGSGAPEWRTYAADVGVPVPGDASRDDVITTLDAAGKPTR